MHHELQNIISGKSQVSHGAAIQAILHHITGSSTTSTLVEPTEQFKIREKNKIIAYWASF